MNTLRGVALRLHGPLQAWGGPVVGDDRATLSFPTRSGVLGLVAACLGILRSDTTRLLALAEGARVHVRVDAPGTPLVDDQTIQGNPNASTTRQTIQSKRTYLCDASFVAVVVPGPKGSLKAIAEALVRPVFAPFLGRRACVPSSPLLLAPEVSGEDPLDLFASLPRGPAELITELGRRAGNVDFYLDVDHHPNELRRLPLRDHFAGPLPRQWRERFAVHVPSSALRSAGASSVPADDAAPR
ncbi:MAG: type I-E CRISPR-associated protein Cas5/CasD [Polyangiaceae bacterium]|nr:type I-E CRISPR-associated protein Cas5/CasD [Polyangiaceae bacterium]